MSAELRELVDAADAWLSAAKAIDEADESVPDEDFRWTVYDAASRRFEALLGYGFDTGPYQVATTIMRFAGAVGA